MVATCCQQLARVVVVVRQDLTVDPGAMQPLETCRDCCCCCYCWRCCWRYASAHLGGHQRWLHQRWVLFLQPRMLGRVLMRRPGRDYAQQSILVAAEVVARVLQQAALEAQLLQLPLLLRGPAAVVQLELAAPLLRLLLLLPPLEKLKC